MHQILILLPAAVFLFAGAFLGLTLSGLVDGSIFREPLPGGALTAILLVNFACALGVRQVWRRARRQAPLRLDNTSIRPRAVFLGGLPQTARITLLAWTLIWSIGFAFGFLGPLIDPFAPPATLRQTKPVTPAAAIP